MGLGARPWELDFLLPTYPGAAGAAPGMGQSYLLPDMVQEEGTEIHCKLFLTLKKHDFRGTQHPLPEWHMVGWASGFSLPHFQPDLGHSHLLDFSYLQPRELPLTPS